MHCDTVLYYIEYVDASITSVVDAARLYKCERVDYVALFCTFASPAAR